MAVLAACSAIPTSGPVQEGDAEVTEPADIDVLAEGPQPGDTPTEIVDGFLAAGAAGFSDQFVTAREYLAGEAKATWKPLAGVVVAGPSQYEPATSTPRSPSTCPSMARVDDGGRYAEAAPEGGESVTFEMVQNDDGPVADRGAPDGLILQQEDFARSYRPASLYFLSPDDVVPGPRVALVPVEEPADVDHDASCSPGRRRGCRTPSTPPCRTASQLKPAVRDHRRRRRGAREPAPALAVTRADRDLLLAQIDASLLPVHGIGSVQVDAGGVLLEPAPRPLQRGNPPPSNVEFLQADKLVALVDGNGHAGAGPRLARRASTRAARRATRTAPSA